MDYYKLARVLKPQGLKGELKLSAYTDDLERFFDLSHIYLHIHNAYERREVKNARIYKRFVYLLIDGIESCEQAEALRGQFLYIDREHAKKPEGTVFLADVIGMSVVGDNGRVFGTVSNVMQTGATDIYEVKGEKSFMFPAAPHVVLKTDEKSRIVTVSEQHLPEVAVYD